MRRTVILTALLLSLALSLGACNFAVRPIEDVFVKEFNDSLRERYHVDSLEVLAAQMSEKLNGVILIAIKDTILVEEAYGELVLKGEPPRREPAENNRITNTTLFDLASISKQFTAAAILKLNEQGKLNLNDKISDYFSNFPYKDVTIKHLLTHTSGIPEYFKFKYQLFDSVAFISNEHLMKVLVKNNFKKNFATGTRFEYTNTNYAILAHLVAHISGMPFEKFVRENLFEPAGMTNTYFFTEIVGIDPENAKKYPNVPPINETCNANPIEKFKTSVARGHKQNVKFAKYDRMNGVLGDKGVYSNVEDMLKWVKAYFIDYKIISKDLVMAAAQRENQLSTGIIPKDIYGYGLRIEENPDHGTLIYHGGLWNGFQNMYLYRPSDDVVIIFLSNYYNKAHAGCSNKVLNIIDEITETEN